MPHTTATYVISADRSGPRHWSELWRYRELLLLLARKDLLVRYKEMAIGVAWVLVKPALTLAIFTVIFGRLANLPSDGVPYPIMVVVGLLPWLFLSSAIQGASESLTGNATLLTKVYFPRAILPLSTVLVSAVDLLIAGTLLLPLGFLYGVYPDWRICLAPAFLALLFIAAAGLGLWLSALTVRYRDFRYITPFLVQLSLYVSPVAFSSSVIPEQWRLVFYLNPLAGIIDGLRWSLLGGKADVPAYAIAISVSFSLIALTSGAAYFQQTERTLADRV